MKKRNLRVLKWLGATPVVGVCTVCNQEFRVPVEQLSRTKDAQEHMQGQFDRHVCAGQESGVRGCE